MTKNKFIVVLGIDAEKKPHAAKFKIAREDAVRKAAQLMGFRIAVPKTEEAQDLADRLIEGKLFVAGKGLVPYVRADLYEKLIQKLELEPEAKGDVAPKPGSAAPIAAQPVTTWADIKVGTIVLCKDTTEKNDPAWWPSVVVAISKDSALLTVRWRDYPKQNSFSVKRSDVGLLGLMT